MVPKDILLPIANQVAPLACEVSYLNDHYSRPIATIRCSVFTFTLRIRDTDIEVTWLDHHYSHCRPMPYNRWHSVPLHDPEVIASIKTFIDDNPLTKAYLESTAVLDRIVEIVKYRHADRLSSDTWRIPCSGLKSVNLTKVDADNIEAIVYHEGLLYDHRLLNIKFNIHSPSCVADIIKFLDRWTIIHHND